MASARLYSYDGEILFRSDAATVLTQCSSDPAVVELSLASYNYVVN